MTEMTAKSGYFKRVQYNAINREACLEGLERHPEMMRSRHFVLYWNAAGRTHSSRLLLTRPPPRRATSITPQPAPNMFLDDGILRNKAEDVLRSSSPDEELSKIGLRMNAAKCEIYQH